MLATQGILIYCANGRTIVPMYADAACLLVFGAFLTSVRLSKNTFLTVCGPLPMQRPLQIVFVAQTNALLEKKLSRAEVISLLGTISLMHNEEIVGQRRECLEDV